MRFVYTLECRARDGQLRWRESKRNLVTIQGSDWLLSQGPQGFAFFVGLIDAAGFSAISDGDTAAVHPGWVENVAYSQGTRPAFVPGSASGGQVDNSASLATYSITANGTIQGAFCSTQATKGGTGGVLYSASAFGTPRIVESGDVLTVQVAQEV